MTLNSSLSESAGSRSLHRLVRPAIEKVYRTSRGTRSSYGRRKGGRARVERPRCAVDVSPGAAGQGGAHRLRTGRVARRAFFAGMREGSGKRSRFMAVRLPG